jgi:hypothetical protein
VKILKNRLFFWVFWIFCLGIPFVITIFPFFKKPGSIQAWSDIWSIVTPMILPALIIGLITASFQYILMKIRFSISPRWFFLTLVGYSLGPIFSVILIISLLGIVYPKTLSTGGEYFQLFPTALAMVLSGFVIGILQYSEIKILFTGKAKKTGGLLWVFLSVLAWSLSFAVGSVWQGQPRLQSMLVGITIGFISGLFFVIIGNENQIKEERRRRDSNS